MQVQPETAELSGQLEARVELSRTSAHRIDRSTKIDLGSDVPVSAIHAV